MTKPHSLESPSSTVFRYPDGRTVNTTPIATIVKDGNWPEPVPLPPVEPGVPDLAEDLIPKALRPYICDAAERTQIPLCFVAVPAMVAMGSLVGRTVGIYPKQADNWLVVPNLWGLVIGRPGVLKSPAIKAGLKPLSRLSAEAREIFESDTAERETDMQIARAELEAAKKSVAEALKKGTKDAITGAKADLLDMNRRLEQKSGLIQKRYTTNDPTIESVGVLLKENPRGILLVRDELYGLLRSMDKFGREGDREFYLEAWNGDGNEGFDIDRIGRGHIHIEALCLSIIGGMQPGKFRSYAAGAFRGGTGDDGLLQRFQLAVWPEFQVLPTVVDPVHRHIGQHHGVRWVLKISQNVVVAGDPVVLRNKQRTVSDRHPVGHGQTAEDRQDLISGAVAIRIPHGVHVADLGCAGELPETTHKHRAVVGKRHLPRSPQAVGVDLDLKTRWEGDRIERDRLRSASTLGLAGLGKDAYTHDCDYYRDSGLDIEFRMHQLHSLESVHTHCSGNTPPFPPAQWRRFTLHLTHLTPRRR